MAPKQGCTQHFRFYRQAPGLRSAAFPSHQLPIATMQKLEDPLLLCAASFTDIEIKHPPNKKRYWIRMLVDGKQVFESQKRDPDSSTSWKEEEKSFPFLPTTTFEVYLIQKHWLHPVSGLVLGRFTGRPGEIVDFMDQSKAIDLENLEGGTISTTITIDFSLETNAAQTIMDGIEKDLSGIRPSDMVGLAQKTVDIANQGYGVVDTLGSCIEPLGNALQAIVKIMDSIADAHPILKVAWTVLSAVYKAVKAQGILDEKILDLSNTFKEMLFVAKTLPDLFVVEGTDKVIDGIGKVAMEVATLMSEYMESSSLTLRMMKYQLSDSMQGRIDDCQKRCKSLQEQFDRRMQLGVAHDVKTIKGVVEHGKGVAEEIKGVVDRINIRDILGDLAYVKGASWAMEECCLEGTREEPIEQILAWIDQADPSKSAEIWLVADVAGSGKSALAHSIGYLSQEKGILKTSFFFQRYSDELKTAVKFISTLALDLSSHSPFAQRVCDIIDKERGVASKFSYRQFEELILKPSSLLPSDKPLVIIIDALDECAEHSDILLKILQDGVPKLPGMFRFLVTSRELDKHLYGQPHVRHRSLGVNEQSNLRDIRTYISHCLVKIFEDKGKQPDAALVDAFSVATEGLFIWASTIIRDLEKALDPEAALQRILEKNHPEQLSTDIKMNQLYTNIIKEHNWSDLDFRRAYSAVMGMVLTAKEPLSISVLMSLNAAISDISDVLGRLHAVLHYSSTEPIRVLHKSFHNFIVNCSSDLPYHIDMACQEQQMAIFCLDTLNQELKEPIPGTGYLVNNALLLKGIPHKSNISISEALWYSCRFGINHCIAIRTPSSALSAALQKLIEMNFVQWIEICAVKGSFTGVNPNFLTWLKSVLPDMQEMVYSIPHLVALSHLSERLRYENRRNEALLVMQPVVEQYRQIAATDPAFNANLAGSLDYYSLSLSDMGCREEALDAIEQAVKLYQQLVTTNLAAFNADFAHSLKNYSLHLSGMGHREKALDAIQKSVELYKQLIIPDPATFNADLACSLDICSLCLSDMGYRQEALDASKQAVELYQELAILNPAVFNADLARSLDNYSLHLSGMGHRKEALNPIQQAVELYQQLATINPAAFNAVFAGSLNNYSLRLSDMGHQKEAMDTIQQAVKLYQQLATTNPAAFNAELARSLNNYSLCLSNMGYRKEALDIIQQAVNLYQELATLNPAAFNADLAHSLGNYSLCLSGMGHRKKALDAIHQAVELHQQLATGNAAAFNAELACSLDNYSLCLSDMGHQEEALDPIRQAVEIYQQLATTNPTAFNADLAHSFNNYSLRLSDIGCQEKALDAIKKAVDLYQQLAATNPDAFNADFAFSLNNYSLHLSNMDHQEALNSIQKAVNIYQQLATTNPAAFNADFARSLNNYSLCLSNMGHRREALDTIQKAVGLYQQLAILNPAVFNADLAHSLGNYSLCLSGMGHQEKALDAIQQAVKLYTELSVKYPAKFSSLLQEAIQWCRKCEVGNLRKFSK